MSNAALTQNILLYIAHTIDQGDHRTLTEIGLDSQHIEQLGRLNLQEFISLGERHKSHFVELKINTQNLSIVLNDIDENRFLNDLIKAGAPNEMICQSLPVTPKQCANRRRSLGIDGYSQKRVPADEAEENTLLEIWQGLKKELNVAEFTAREWLKLHEEITLRYKRTELKVVWSAIHNYLLNEAEFQNKLRQI